jgi:tRNA G10  N-methylase Trm11
MAKRTRAFIAQTGHGKGLAKAELINVLGDCVIDEVDEGWVFETEIEDPKATLNRMGGWVRLTEVIQRGPVNMPLNFVDWVTQALENCFDGKDHGKIRFGLSMHPKSAFVLKKTLNEAKKKAKSKLGNCRFINKDFQNLSSVQAWHEDLLGPSAAEFNLFKSENYWYLTQTLAIQDFESYGKRDMERPAKSARNGMLPPKLAQTLINLAGPCSMVYDPFCGSGTLLQEAWMMGLKAQGSDLEDKQVSDARINLDWLQREFRLQGHVEVFQADATKLTAQQLPKEPFVMVTETWLGPVLSHAPSALELPKIQREIEGLYSDWLHNLKKIIKEELTIVFTAPYHREHNDRHFLPRLPELLAEYGEIVPLSTHERPSLFYERKGQIVGREIWKLTIKPHGS